MMFEIEFSERARKHMREATDWIADRSPTAASRWLDRLKAAVYSLEQNPERFPPAPENSTHEIEIHQMLFGKRRGQYRVLYTIAEQKVVVLDVRHSAQQWLEPGELDERT